MIQLSFKDESITQRIRFSSSIDGQDGRSFHVVGGVGGRLASWNAIILPPFQLRVLEHGRQVLEHLAGHRLLLLEQLQFWNIVRYDAEQTAFGATRPLIRVVPGVQSFPGTVVAAENGWRR